jgi:hypothetical protein
MLCSPVFAFTQPPGEDLSALLADLGNGNFQRREAATKALRERPEAEAALRKLLDSPDSETRKRVAEILDYYDRRPIREINTAIDEGRVLRVTEMLARWPKGKHDEDAWLAFTRLAHRLTDLHEKQGGAKVDLTRLLKVPAPQVISAKRVTASTRAEIGPLPFVRAGDINMDDERPEPGKSPNAFSHFTVVAAAGRVQNVVAGPYVIFAGGDVNCLGSGNLLIVSGGDVTICDLTAPSLIIARGNVKSQGVLAKARVITGKSVFLDKKKTADCIITENEPNPLGYIRWSDEPKAKPAPKSK